MVNFILVMVGGGLGAMLREFLMLMVPNLADGFPLAILVANLLATFLLGLVTGLHGRQVLSDNISMLVGTGIIGGMSTFSSLAYGAVVLIEDSSASAAVASVYVATSLLFGYLAAIGGMKTGLRLVCSPKITRHLRSLRTATHSMTGQCGRLISSPGPICGASGDFQWT